MIELYGWMKISETFENEDLLSEHELKSIMQDVEEIISSNTCGIRLQYLNGTAFIQTLFCSNHHTPEVDEIIETYKSIAKTATGSYGMIYLRDDEDKKYDNAFQMYLFKKGKCSDQIDTNFSPCIPTIERDVSL